MADQKKLNISMPANLCQWVNEVVARDELGTASQYIQRLIRNDRRRRLREQIEQELLLAVKSSSVESSPRVWATLDRQVQARIKRNKKRRAA